MHIAIPFSDLTDAMRENGAKQSVINKVEGEYCNDLGQYGRVSIYTHPSDLKKLNNEVEKVVRQWQAAGFIPTDKTDEYAHFFLYNDD